MKEIGVGGALIVISNHGNRSVKIKTKIYLCWVYVVLCISLLFFVRFYELVHPIELLRGLLQMQSLNDFKSVLHEPVLTNWVGQPLVINILKLSNHQLVD